MSFDPPRPPRDDRWWFPRAVANAAWIVPLSVILRPLLLPFRIWGLVRAIRRGELFSDKDPHVPPLAVPDLTDTAPPAIGIDGLVACSRCRARVALASMSVNENGYFCSRCATD